MPKSNVREGKVRGLTNALLRQTGAIFGGGDVAREVRRTGAAAEGLTEAEIHEAINRYNKRLGRH